MPRIYTAAQFSVFLFGDAELPYESQFPPVIILTHFKVGPCTGTNTLEDSRRYPYFTDYVDFLASFSLGS
jgi:hypothetical protein